jgi:hypothetical protein
MTSEDKPDEITGKHYKKSIKRSIEPGIINILDVRVFEDEET